MVLKVYLVVYFALLAAALFALWESGALGQLPAEWVVLVVVAAVLLGVLLAVVSRHRPPATPA